MPSCRLPGTMLVAHGLACIPTSKKGARSCQNCSFFRPLAALISAGSAYADTMATTTRDLNVRAGPGSQNPVIGVIGSGQSVDVNGCVQNGRWCTVAFEGGEGWVSARYLAGDFDASQVVVTEQPTAAIRTTRPASPAAGTGAGRRCGRCGRRRRRRRPGRCGGRRRCRRHRRRDDGHVLDPPTRVRTYVSSNRMRPVYLQANMQSAPACRTRSSCARFPTMTIGTST